MSLPIPPSVGLPLRLARALRFLRLEAGEDVSQGQLGDMIAAELDRKTPYTQGAVQKWLAKGTSDIDVVWAWARACGVNFLWLATGEGPMQASSRSAEAEVALNPRPRLTAEEAIQELREGAAVAGSEGPTPTSGGRRKKAT